MATRPPLNSMVPMVGHLESEIIDSMVFQQKLTAWMLSTSRLFKPFEHLVDGLSVNALL